MVQHSLSSIEFDDNNIKQMHLNSTLDLEHVLGQDCGNQKCQNNTTAVTQENWRQTVRIFKVSTPTNGSTFDEFHQQELSARCPEIAPKTQKVTMILTPLMLFCTTPFLWERMLGFHFRPPLLGELLEHRPVFKLPSKFKNCLNTLNQHVLTFGFPFKVQLHIALHV
jgi:hypothetical protein